MNKTAEKLFILLFASIALVFIVFAVAGGFKNYSALPLSDMWTAHFFISDGWKSEALQNIWRQHNEHRMVLSKILFLIDQRVFNASGAFLIICNYLLITSICVTLLIFLREKLHNHDRNYPFLIIAALVTMLAFSWKQKSNLIWAFQSQFIFSVLIPLLTFYFFYKYKSNAKHAKIYFGLTIVCALLSYMTMANGIIVFPLLICLAILLKEKPSIIVFMSLLACMATFFFFKDYNQISGHSLFKSNLLENPFATFLYGLTYLSAPIYKTTDKNFILGYSIGLLMLGATVYYFINAFYNSKNKVLDLSLIFMLFFVIGSAFVTAAGRYEPWEEAYYMSSRYMTPTLTAWAILLILTSDKLINLFSIQPLAATVFLLLCTGLLWEDQGKAFKDRGGWQHRQYLSALALELRVEDEDQLKSTYPQPEVLMKISKDFVEKKKGIFKDPKIADIRKRIGEIYSSSSSPLFTISEVKIQAMENCNKVVAKAPALSSKEPLKRVFFLDTSVDKIVGAAFIRKNKLQGYYFGEVEADNLRVVML